MFAVRKGEASHQMGFHTFRVMSELSFNPELCRNESEVESKLIVSYLLPKLGYPPETWHQEVSFGTIRLDFLAFATQRLPFVLDASSPLSVVIEAKSPRQKLDRHVRKFRRYLTSLNIRYGLLTNGKELRIYEKINDDIWLVFQCEGKTVEAKIEEIKAIIGKDSLKTRPALESPAVLESQPNPLSSQPGVAHFWDEEPHPPTGSERGFSMSGKSFNHPSGAQRYQPISQQTFEEVEAPQPAPEPAPEPVQLNPQPICEPSSEVKRQNTVKIIAVYHNKGGVGKTTTVVNLAAALRKKGKRVLVIDLDSQANTTFAAGLVKFDDEDLDDIKDCNVRHVLSSEDFYSISEVAKKSQYNDPEIDVVPSHITLMQYENELNQVEYSKLILLQKLKDVAEQYDIVIIDTPPSLNLYARIALITADYLIVPSDLKPFANQGLVNVKTFVKKTNEFRRFIGKNPVEILGVLPCKISTNARFREYTLPKHIEIVPKRYDLKVMDTIIYQREDLSKCLEQTVDVGDLQIPDPRSVFDFQPFGESAKEFDQLAKEVLKAIGLAK
jgi:cellulose biosynthesis protein BcsQ